MHILEAILIVISVLAMIFGGYVLSAVGGAEEDVSGAPGFIGCGALIIGIMLAVLGVALRVLV